MLSIIATSFSILSFTTNVSGQTSTDCSPACAGCNGDAPGCQDALDQGCQYNFDTDICERVLCGIDCRLCDGDAPGCDNDPSCWYVPDNEQCRLKDTCGSDCTFCDNNQTCVTEGAGGDNVCFIAQTGPNAGTCVGTTCDTDCELCDSGVEAQCTGSRAAPNGCVFDASEGCSAATRNPTADPTPSPTPTPTDNPTEFPTTGNPTTGPNVGPSVVTCGQTRNGDLPANDVQFFGLIIIQDDTTRVVISTCFAFTTFATKLELFNGTSGNLIASDQGGCATGSAAEIDIPNGLPAGGSYDLEVSGVDSSQFGLYRIQILCETAEPTASPTTSEPTNPPTGTQTTIAPTGSPTTAPSDGPTPEPTPKPSPVPTTDPTFEPTTAEPSDDPSPSPTDIPTNAPTGAPTPPPTNKPTTSPTALPTPEPTENPTTAEPTNSPSNNPTMEPIEQQCPDCAFEATLVEIGDVEVKNCTDESDSVSGSDSDSDSDSDAGGRRNYWNKRQRGDDSSDRRRLLSDSDSSDSDSDSSSGYAPWNKRCIYPKGSGSGSDSDSKYRRRSLLGRGYGSESSDGTDQGDEEDDGGYSDWYTEKCFGDEDGSGSGSSDSKSYSRDRRRRRMTGSSFDGWGTKRQRAGRSLLGSDFDSDSSDSGSSSSNGYATWSKDDEFITEVCITYNVTDLVEDDALDCGDVRSLFLGICENNQTDFNSSTIDEEDINNLIVSISPNDTLTAEGASDDGTLGVFISFSQDSGVEQFELCLGNVTVDSDFNENKDMIDIGNGTIRIRRDDEDTLCPSDGLPCLNFFFDTPCPEVFTTTDDGKSCDCMGGITEFTARYDGECTASSITVYLKGNLNTAVCTFNNVSPGDELTCASSSAGKDRFKRNTHIVVECDDESKSNVERRLLSSDSGDSGDDSDCTAKFKTRCQTQIVGTQSEGCSDFTIISTTDREGGFCDEDELNSADGSSSYNALAIGELSINDPLEVFTSLDPYIQYTLIGLMVTFVVLMFVACYICIGKDKLHKNKNENIKDNMEDDINDMNKHTSWSEYGGINQTKTDLVDDHDEDEECYLSDNGQTHQQVNTVDDSDDDYYETNAGQQVEMEIMKNVSSH